MADESLPTAPVTAESQLPPFPSAPLGQSNETLLSAYRWAGAVVDTYGDAAETFIQMGMLKAVERNDMAAFRGWQNIKFAMIDLWRLPAPGEPLH